MVRATVALMILVGSVSNVPASLFHGRFLHGDQPAGGAWSYGHRATSHPDASHGNWTQHAGGLAAFAIDPAADFFYQYQDNGVAGLSDGDVIQINIEVPILDYSGNIFANPTLGNTVGTVLLSGYLTVGGPASAAHTHGLSGSGETSGTGFLDFKVNFTDQTSQGDYEANDTIDGRMFVQAAGLTSQFNGISQAGNDLGWSISGDNRPPSPNFFDSDGPNALTQSPWGTLTTADGNIIDGHGFGFDLVVESERVPPPTDVGIIPNPEPASCVAWAVLLITASLGYRVRHRRPRIG